MTSLSFPATCNPLVSVVIPAHGSWGWTCRTLTAVREHTDVPYELIVCDNASSDETRERLSALRNVALQLNAKNLGFPAACNQGAALARAPYLVFLNSDAMPSRRWLGPLVDQLADVGVGAVGPRLLNLDGTLQEAGSTVLGDGMTIRHGDRLPATAPEYGFPRGVDYVSGACLAIPRATFHEIGGFDTAYGVGYFEDADLCFELRERGFRVVYEPDSVVTHARGASSRSDVRDAVLAANLDRFVERWRRVLAGRPTLAQMRLVHHVVARDLTAPARILVMLPGTAEPLPAFVGWLASALPDGRVTVVAEGTATAARSVEWIASDDPGKVLSERRFLYDLVFWPTSLTERVEEALARYQPQAQRVGIVDGTTPASSALDGVDAIVCLDGATRATLAGTTDKPMLVATGDTQRSNEDARMHAFFARLGAWPEPTRPERRGAPRGAPRPLPTRGP